VAYQPLDNKSVVDYVKNRPALENILPAHSHLVAKEVGDGNLNLVFI
jgi:5-methylthioribose kinase